MTTALDRLTATFGLQPTTTPPPIDADTRLVLAGLARGRKVPQVAADLSGTTGHISQRQVQYRLRLVAIHFQVPNEHAAVVHQAYLAGWLTSLPHEARPPVCAEPMPLRLRQVLDGIAAGHTNAQIGRHLHLTEHTIKTYARRVFRHLAACNRAHAVALAHQYGHLTADQPRCQEATSR